jgi:hypothetical protein
VCINCCSLLSFRLALFFICLSFRRLFGETACLLLIRCLVRSGSSGGAGTGRQSNNTQRKIERKAT